MGLRPTQGDEKRLPLSSRPKRTRISCHASLTSGTVCGFHQGKPHEVRRRHQLPQEIRGSEVEGPAVRPGPTQLFANPLRFVISTGESHPDRIVIYGKRAALHVFRQSEAKWRDLLCALTPNKPPPKTTNIKTCHPDRRVMGLRPTEGDEKCIACFSTGAKRSGGMTSCWRLQV